LAIPQLSTYTLLHPSYIIGSRQYAWTCATLKLKTHTSLTVLNSSLEARAFGSPDSLDGFAGGGVGPCLVLSDWSMSKNCWTCSVVTIGDDVWFAGDEAICMATTALTISINSWALLNVITRSDDGRLGLLGGVHGRARPTEGLAWIISVRAIVNETRRMGRPFDGRDSKIYIE
jgi:hypothetical protein